MARGGVAVVEREPIRREHSEERPWKQCVSPGCDRWIKWEPVFCWNCRDEARSSSRRRILHAVAK
jgi:hypothetical protein